MNSRESVEKRPGRAVTWLGGTVGIFSLAVALCGPESFAVPRTPPSSAQPLHFERIGTENGPPAEVITALFQDASGFIWIGSRDGLTLYDGYTFTIFEHDPTDPTTISDNTIRTIHEDRQGNLWVGTNTGGLNRLNRSTGTFDHFRHDSGDPSTLSHDSVYAVLEDKESALWIGTQVGLNRFDPETERFERFVADERNPTSLSHDYVFSLHEDRDGVLWVSTIGGGLNRRDSVSGGFTAFRHDPDDAETLTTDDVLQIVGDESGALWISSRNGLNLLNRTTGRVRRFEHVPGDRQGLSDPLVTSLALGPSGELWVGTHGGGLDRLDIESGRFQNWRHDPAQLHSLGSDEIIALMADATGALWVGTWGGGLNRVSSASYLLSEFADMARLPADLDVADITGLMMDRRGGLWIGTRSGDVVRRDLERTVDRTYLRGGSAGVPRIVLGFAESRQGDIWVATSAGIVRLDPATGEHADITHHPGDPASLGPGYVKAMHIDRAGVLWIGTGEGGLQQLDAAGNVVRRFLNDPSDAASLSDPYVTAIHEDRRGTLWIGTRSGGLNEVDPRSGRVIRHQPRPGQPGALSHHYVTSVLEDAAGTLWVGTGGGGLNRVDRQASGAVQFTRVSESVGLIDDNVMGMVEDDDGSLWISTKTGVTRFDPRSAATVNLFVADGLPSGEFESAAAARNRETICFGSVKGLVAVPAGTPFPSPRPSPTVIASIRTAEGERWNHGSAGTLEVPWGDWVSLRFAVLDFRADRGHRYAYRLGDDDSEWVDLGSGREITFTDLNPGSYRFGVRGQNSQGIWSELDSKFEIEVVPPFWMTTWFKAVIALFLIAAIVLGHRWRISLVAKRHQELLRLHEQREKAQAELGVAYARLRRLTHRLEVATEEERTRIARELHDEMGPTLTAVIINLQLLARDPAAAGTADKLEDSIELVDRMVQRVRDLSLDLRPPLLEELGLVPALRGYLESQGQRAALDISVDADAEGPALSQEAEIASFRVVQEAVTNVIRHADARRVTVSVHHNGASLDLRVKDDGRGFNVTDTMEGPTAKALGLLGMQERVFTLGGTVVIDSVPGQGTEVRVQVPVGSVQ